MVTPWYPSANNPLAGAFVQAAIGAIRADHDRISILHTEDWPYRQDAPNVEALSVAAGRLATRVGPVVRDTEAGEATRVPVPISSRRDYAAWALAHVEALRLNLPTGQIEAPLVHAHTGIYGGVVAQRLARPDARVVVTEHASFLAEIFKQPAARRLYEEALHRADVFLCVSEHLRAQVVDEFPHHAHKLRVIPNAIDFSDFAPRTEPPRDLLRWLYVGRLSQQKGVDRVLAAFLAVAAEEPAATSDTGRHRSAGRPDPRGGRAQPVRGPGGPAPGCRAGRGARADADARPAGARQPGRDLRHDGGRGGGVRHPGAGGRQHGAAGDAAWPARARRAPVEISEDPTVLVDGFRELRKRIDELDLPAARATLVERYGREAVAARLREVYAVPPAATAEPVAVSAPATTAAPERVATPTAQATAGRDDTAPRVVLVAISPPQFKVVRQYVRRLLERGYGVDVITNDPLQWRRSQVDERVRLLPLDTAERRRPVLRTEQLLVYRVPGKALSVARDRTRETAPLWPELFVSRLERTHASAARWFHTSVFYPGYRVVRPRLLWRIVRRDVLRKLDLARTERVVVAGVFGVSIGWQLGRLRPEMTITTSLVPPEPVSR